MVRLKRVKRAILDTVWTLLVFAVLIACSFAFIASAILRRVELWLEDDEEIPSVVRG